MGDYRGISWGREGCKDYNSALPLNRDNSRGSALPSSGNIKRLTDDDDDDDDDRYQVDRFDDAER